MEVECKLLTHDRLYRACLSLPESTSQQTVWSQIRLADLPARLSLTIAQTSCSYASFRPLRNWCATSSDARRTCQALCTLWFLNRGGLPVMTEITLNAIEYVGARSTCACGSRDLGPCPVNNSSDSGRPAWRHSAGIFHVDQTAAGEGIQGSIVHHPMMLAILNCRLVGYGSEPRRCLHFPRRRSQQTKYQGRVRSVYFGTKFVGQTLHASPYHVVTTSTNQKLLVTQPVDFLRL